MNKIYSLLICVLFFSPIVVNAQIAVTVTNNTNTTPNLAVSYTSFANALAALNAVTAMSGPVTFTLAAGSSESAPTTGLTIGSASLNPVLSAANTVTIVKAAGAATTLNSGTGGTGTPSTAVQDGILNILGADHITIDGLTLADVNAFGPASMEYGIGLFKLSATDGASFNTIINCIISLNKENNANGAGPSAAGSRGINVVNALVTAQVSALSISNATGANSGNKFYANAISNCNIAVSLSGYVDASPFANADQNNDVGGIAAATGNNIFNFGGAAGATNAAAGVQTVAQYGVNVSYNNINNNDGSGVNHTQVIRAIYLNTALGASATASNNTISIKAGGATTNLYIIENQSGGTGSGNTVNISGNVFENCSFLNQTTGVFRGIFNGATVANLLIASNTFNTVAFNPSAATAIVSFIYQGVTVGTLSDINSNVFLDQAINTSGNVYLIYDSNGTPNISINSNSTSGTIAKTAAGNGFYGYYNNGSPAFGTATIVFNTFSNISVTGATNFYGIRLTTLQAQIEIINTNFISNITAGTNEAVGIFFDYGAVGSEVSGNFITNIAGGGTVTGIQLGSFTASLGLTALGNYVGSLSSTGGSPVTGILHVTGAASTISKNRLYDLSSSNGVGTVFGISMTGGTIVNIINNLVGDLRNSSANTANALVGLGIAGGTTANVFYNTVYLNGTSLFTPFGSSSLSVTTTTAAVNLRNNILVNLSTPQGTGLTVAHRRSTTSLTGYNTSSNNNLLYAGAPSASRLIFYDGTNSDQTLAAYKTRVTPRDGASVTENPSFLSVNGLDDPFLHLNPAVATQAESGGANISSYTDDYDYDIRQGNTGYGGSGSAPDIGADEGNFILLDLAPPVISSITSTSASCGVGTRTFTAVLTDATGINNNPGLRPRIYFRKNAAAYFSTEGTLSAGTVTNGTWTFTINYALVGGVILGDVMDYFLVAQDAAPGANVAGNPSAGLVLTNVNTIVTPPTTPLTYSILNALSGTYNVGAGQTYITLTAAITAYNTSCLTGPVVFLLKDALYSGSETFPIVINANADANSTNTLTIKPDVGVTAVVTGSSAAAIIQFNGADYVTIDGSNNGSSSRNLTISNSNTGTNSLVVWLNSTAALDGATNNTVKNTIITGNAPTTTFVGIYSGGSILPNYAEANNNGNTYTNNAISAVSYGIGTGGATGNDNNTVVSDNLLSNIGFRGIYAANQNGVNISNNTIAGLSSTNASSFNPSGGIIVESEIAGGSISRNNISNIKNTGSYASYGITLQSSTVNTGLTISNNFLYDIASNGSAVTLDNNGYGIAVTAGGGYRIYYNSVSINSNQGTPGVSAALYLRSGLLSSSLDIRNNIFANSQTTGSTYAIYSRSGNGTFSNINNNDYYNASGGNVGFLTSNRATITAWRTATGSDLNSVSVNPNFISAVNLHINTLVAPTVDGLAVVLPAVTIDYDLDARDAATPDMGADEYIPPPCSGAVGGTASDNGNAAFCGSGTPVITASGYSGGPGSGYQWQSSTTLAFGTPVDITGQTNPSLLTVGSISATTYYRLRVTCTSGAATNFSNIITITINNPSVSSPVIGSRCGTGTVNLSATPSAGANLDWYSSLTGGLSLYTGNTFTTPVISATTTYYVAASIGGATENAGKLVPTGTAITDFDDAGFVFNTTQNTTIVSTVVYPNGSGTITIALQNSAGTELAVTGAIAVSGTGISTPVTVPLGFAVPVGIGYRLVLKTLTGFPGFSDGLIRDASGNTYPYTSPSGALSVTGGWLSGAITNYYYFFNLVITTACSSTPRVAITATVIAATPVSAAAAPPAICEGLSTTLTATSANPGYAYTWTPGSLLGASVSVSPATSTTYTVNAFDAGSGCAASATVTVNVNARPSVVSVNPNPATICGAGSVQLDAFGGIASGTVNENSGAISIVIPDANATGISSNLPVASIPAGATIDSIIVSFDITQTYVGDQIIHLEAPNGQIINLVSGQSLGSLDNFTGTRISSDNSKPNISSGTAPYTGTFRADAALSFQLTPSIVPTTTNFSALFTVPNGNWILRVFDDAGGDIGTLTNWSIRIVYKSPATFTWSPAANLNTTSGPTVIASPPASTNYTATATNASGCTRSIVVAVNVNSNPVSVAVTQNPAGAVCPNSPVQFTATGTNPGLTPNYRWLINGVEPVVTLSGGSSINPSTTITVANTAGLMVGMRVTVTAGVGAFNFSGLTTVTSILSATQFVVDLVPTSSLSGATISAVSNGINITTLSPANLVTGDVVTCVLTSNVSCPTGNPATSTPITMTVNPNTATSVSIAAVPAGAICAGTSVIFTATPTNGGAAPTYEWFIGAVSQGVPSTLATSFTSAALANTNVVTCRMLSNATNCPAPNPSTSAGITMTVNPNLPVTVSIAAVPPGAICAGTSVTFTATPTNEGGAPIYDFMVNGSSVQSSSSPTYTTTSLNDLDIVTCELTSSITPCATGNPATSNALNISVSVLAASVAISPNTGLCSGSPVIFTATPTNGGTASFEFFVNGGTMQGPNASTTYSYTPAPGDIISVDMVSSLGCASPNPATATTAAVNARPTASITSPGTVLCSGYPMVFTAVAAAGSGTINAGSYQWVETAPTLNVGSGGTVFSSSTAGKSYYVTVTNSNGCSVNSNTIGPLTTNAGTPMNGLLYTIGAVTATASGASAGTTINVGSTAGLVVGQAVAVTSGTGAFTAAATVASITNGTQFVVSAMPTTALALNATISGATCLNYISFKTAIDDLNTRSVDGACTFTAALDFVENITAQLKLGNAILNTASGTWPITFQKSAGAGANPRINAAFVGTGTAATAAPDGIWSLNGIDNVTIDAIDLNDNNSLNANTTMEFGYGLFKLSLNDGTQNNTIRNCAVSLSRVNNSSAGVPMVEGAVGILVVNSVVTAATTPLIPTLASGANSNNKFYSNTIQNCHHGIALSGYAAPLSATLDFPLGDKGNDIGGAAAATGNTIFNFGGTVVGATQAAGIRISQQWGANVSFNTINNDSSNTLPHPQILKGIWAQAAQGASATINNNTVTVKGGGTTQAVTGIENLMGANVTAAAGAGSTTTITVTSTAGLEVGMTVIVIGGAGVFASATTIVSILNATSFTVSAAPTVTLLAATVFGSKNTIAINNNRVTGTYTTATTGAWSGITTVANVGTININGNTVQNVSLPGSGLLAAINNSAVITTSPRVLTINNNVVQQMNKSAAVGASFTLVNSGNMPILATSTSIIGNTVNNNTVVASNITAFSYNWIGYLGGSTYLINNNIVTNNAVTGLSAAIVATVGGIASNGAGSSNETFSGNTIDNLSITGTGTVAHVLRGIASTTSSTKLIEGNTISNLVASSGLSTTISGIQTQALIGTSIVSKNYIYNLFPGQGATASVARGIVHVSGTTVTISNNVVALDFTATPPVIVPAAANNVLTGSDAVRGIEIGGGTTINVWYNSVNLVGAGSGASFGSSAISQTTVSATNTLDIRNNIFNNIMTPGGTSPGFTVAYRRNGVVSQYSTNSNYNAFYAGTPSASRLLYFNGTVGYQDIASFRAGVAGGREALSNDLPTTFTSNINLLPTGVNCANDGAGNNNVILLATDYAGAARSTVNPFTTDIGAYEFSSTNATSLVINTPAAVCTGTTVDLTLPAVTAGSTAGAVFRYYTNNTGTILMSAPPANAVNVSGNYYIRAFVGSCASAAPLPVVAVTINPNNTWLGINNDWNSAANWCPALPTGVTDVTIPGALSIYPVITTNTPVARNITIAAGASVTITGTGVLDVKGNLVNSGDLANGGEIRLSGSAAQSFPGAGGTVSAMVKLTIANISGLNPAVTINNNLLVRDVITPTQGIVNLSNVFITLRSNVDSTARVGVVGGAASFTYTGTGNFVVERYYPSRRTWRLLTAPVVTPLTGANTKTIFGSWQAGGNNSITGNGTFVSGPTPNMPVNGLDMSPLNNSSLKRFNFVTSGFDAIGNTRLTRVSGFPAGSTSSYLTDTMGYFVFIRGDRTAANVDAFNNFGVVTTTTLRDTGNIKTGTFTYNCNPTLVTHYFTLIGNPYASPVDFSTLTRNNVADKFWAWDPNLNAVGGYVTLSGPGYAPVKAPLTSLGTSAQTEIIQSSQAIMVQTTGAAPTISFNEANKSSLNNLNVFRPAGNAPVLTLASNIFIAAQDGSNILADGAVTQFDERFLGAIDELDAAKFTNVNETFGIVSNNKNLSIERRPVLTENDTLFYSFNRNARKNYKFNVLVKNFAQSNLTGLLEDGYLKTNTAINMNGDTWSNFSVTSDVASAAKDRFRIVFKKLIQSSSIKGYVVNTDIAVDWRVATEFSISHYEIERSVNGTDFEQVGTQHGTGNSIEDRGYSWLDASPAPGIYYYRVKCIGSNGAVAYTDKVKVTIVKSSPQMYVFPNPVTSSSIGLQMNSMPGGNYHTTLMTEDGTIVNRGIIIHAAGTAVETIRPKNYLASGSYRLEVTGPDKNKTILKIIVQMK